MHSQFWDNENTKDPQDPNHIIGSMPNDLKPRKYQEISKQGFVYTMAKRGFIWLHGTHWATPTNGLQESDVQKLLMRNSSLTTKTVVDFSKQEDIDKYLNLLASAKRNEGWFTSMWTFQEGILLNVDRIIDPRDGSLIKLRNQNSFSVFVDKNGNTLNDEGFFRNETAGFIDITGGVTIAMCDIASALADASIVGDETKVQKLQKILTSLADKFNGHQSKPL